MIQWASIMLACLCGVLAFFLNEARQDAGKWKEKADVAQSEHGKLKEAFAAREARLNALSRQVAAQRKQLREAMKDENNAKWGAVPVPDAVSGVLKGK